MSNTTQNNQAPTFTNPLQNNTTAIAVIGYVAGLAAGKLTFFDFATWNYIFMSVGGLVFGAWQFYATRKTAVVATVANMPEVNRVELDRAAPGVDGLEANTPNNVVAR